jgi:hypothetical protein
LLGSELVLVHTPRQYWLPGAHRQAPFTQSSPVGQLRLHAPQWLESESRSTHDEPQAVNGEVQLVTQPPLEHSWPAGHCTPQAPQWLGSEEVSTQLFPQRV